MNKIDYTRFDFHALRFLKSEDIELMTAEEIGQFVLLMCHAWLGGKAASLPQNPTLLARYARCEQVSELVLSQWKQGEDGRLYNDALSEEWDAVLERSGQGKRGADARWNKNKPFSNAHQDAPALLTQSPTNGQAVSIQAVSTQLNSNQTKPAQSGADAPAETSPAVSKNPSLNPSNNFVEASDRVAEHLLAKLGPTDETLTSSANHILPLFGIPWLSPAGEAKSAPQIETVLKGIIDFAFSTEFWPQFITTTDSFVRAVLKKGESNSLPQQWRGSLRRKVKTKNSVIEGVSSLNKRNGRPAPQINPGWDKYKQTLESEKED
jgi:uncharacterized protein YdaU (DUF1376 family)